MALFDEFPDHMRADKTVTTRDKYFHPDYLEVLKSKALLLRCQDKTNAKSLLELLNESSEGRAV
jgi:hypothetical protein